MPREKDVINHLIVLGPLGKNDPKHPDADMPIANGAERYSKNIYFYWHQFFRAYWDWDKRADGPDAALIRQVKKDFKTALEDGFEQWWFGGGRMLFSHQHNDEIAPVPIRNAQDLRPYKDGMIVFLPYDGHFPSMMKDLRPKFDDAVDAFYLKKPRNKRRYQLYTQRYQLTAIRNQLIVYHAVMADLKANGADKPTPYRRIFDRIDNSLILQTDWQYWDRVDKTYFIARNFRKACRLAYHVARGEFPRADEPPSDYLPARSNGRDEGDLREAHKSWDEDDD